MRGRTEVEGKIAFEEWVQIIYGKVDRETKMSIWADVNHSEESNDPELLTDNEGDNDHEPSNDIRG